MVEKRLDKCHNVCIGLNAYILCLIIILIEVLYRNCKEYEGLGSSRLNGGTIKRYLIQVTHYQLCVLGECVMIFLIIIQMAIILFLIIYFYVVFFKRSNAAENEFLAYAEKENHDSYKKAKFELNRRRFFRITLEEDDIDCDLIFLDFGNDKFKNLINKRISAKVIDLSVGGMRFACEYDLPVQNHIVSMISFEINDERFYLKCELARKEVKMENDNILYGVRFINLDKKTEGNLGKIIHQLEIKQQKTG